MDRGRSLRRGYIAFILGVLVGFLIFLLASAVFSLQPLLSALRGGREAVEITFLYTSEKQSWIERVTPMFEEWFEENYGYRVKVNLVVAGSHETVNLILHGSVKPTAWSPASSVWIPYLNAKWRLLGYSYDIAGEGTPLVYSPVVIAAWKSFVDKYRVSGFNSLFRLAEEGVKFRYGHPDPMLSNGGVSAFLLEVASAAGKPVENLTTENLLDVEVERKVSLLESLSVKYGKSTGFFGRWAAESGPTAIQIFVVYENVVIDNSLMARRKWGDPLIAVYPEEGTILCDHPYVILDAPWITGEQRDIAEAYLSFLLSPKVQVEAVKHGLRPSIEGVQLDPKIFSSENGVKAKIDVPVYRTVSSGRFLDDLLTFWSKVRAGGAG